MKLQPAERKVPPPFTSTFTWLWSSPNFISKKMGTRDYFSGAASTAWNWSHISIVKVEMLGASPPVLHIDRHRDHYCTFIMLQFLQTSADTWSHTDTQPHTSPYFHRHWKLCGDELLGKGIFRCWTWTASPLHT
jgi:hypothetical protein